MSAFEESVVEIQQTLQTILENTKENKIPEQKGLLDYLRISYILVLINQLHSLDQTFDLYRIQATTTIKETTVTRKGEDLWACAKCGLEFTREQVFEIDYQARDKCRSCGRLITLLDYSYPITGKKKS